MHSSKQDIGVQYPILIEQLFWFIIQTLGECHQVVKQLDEKRKQKEV